jgi:Na+/proline symporter
MRGIQELPDHLRMGDEDLTELLQELRVLLPGTQTLTAFLIILPFNSGFADIQRGERLVYLATFLCSLASLVLFAAPAAQHRLQRPLRDREAFKQRATQLIIAGLVLLSFALVLATQLVLDEVLRSFWLAWGGAGAVALLILAIWWIVPLRTKARLSHQD